MPTTEASPHDAGAGAESPARAQAPARRPHATPSRAQGSAPAAPLQARPLPRVDHPAPVPEPEHHHLPGWVRRAHAKARPPLGDLLALLEGPSRDRLRRRLDELTEGINAGRFSLAWEYPTVVAEGRALFERQREEQSAASAARRSLENARRRVADEIRSSAEALTADAVARLTRAIKAAQGSEAVAAVASELSQALSTSRSSRERRRQREIDRTRARIDRATPRADASTPETWQDVLRRFAEQQESVAGR